MPDENERAEYIAGLRALADALESDPGLTVPFSGSAASDLSVFIETKEELQHWVRVMPGRKDKQVDDGDDNWGFRLAGAIRGLHVLVYAPRDEVCTARIVGTKTVERRIPIDYQTVTEEVPEVEWDCGSLLASS